MKVLNQFGSIHTLPLLLIVVAVGIISFLLITATAPIGGLFGTINPKPESHAAVGGSWINATGNLAGMASTCGNSSLLSAVPGSDTVIAGIDLKGLWKTTNSGVSWTQMGNSNIMQNSPLWITYDPNNPAIFWESGIHSGDGIYKTTNGGTTFQQLPGVATADFMSVDFTDPNRQTLLAGGHEQSQNVWKSTNGGATWTNIGLNLPSGTGFTESPLAINSQTYVVNTDTSWGGGTPGIYRTTNGGTTWTKVSTTGPSSAPLLTSNGIIYWPNGNGLLKSTDSGVTWTQVGSGLQAIHPIELPDGRLVSVGGSTLLISANGGSTWSGLGPNLPFNNTAGVIYSPNRAAFFIWHNDCGNVVLSDAVMKLDFDSVSTSPLPSSSAVPTPVPTPGPTSTPSPLEGPFNGPHNLSGTLQLEDYDSGGEGIAYHDLEALNQGGGYRTTEGVDIQPTTDTGGGFNVGWTQAGEWMRYFVNVTTTGTYNLGFRVASQGAGGTFHLEVDGVDKTGAMTVPDTANWQTFTTITKSNVSLTSGAHVLRLVMDTNGAGGGGGNFNYLTVTQASIPTPTPVPTPVPGKVVILNINPAAVSISTGQTTTLSLQMDTKTDQVTAAEIHLTFDPSRLQIQSIAAAGTLLPAVLIPAAFDNTAGTASITLGSQPSTPASGTGTVATVAVKALNTSGSTAVNYAATTQTASIGKTGTSLSASSGSNITINLTCPKGPLGDVNCDNLINIFDYNQVVTDFGRSGAGILGDVNKDGTVNIFDYNIIVTNFGQ